MPDLWLNDIQTSELIMEEAASQGPNKVEADLLDLPEGFLLWGRDNSNSIFFRPETWSSLAMVLLLHSLLVCLLWHNPKSQNKADKLMEVQLVALQDDPIVALQGDPNASGSGRDGSLDAGPTGGENGVEAKPGEVTHRENTPPKSIIPPAEKKTDTQQHTLLMKHVTTAPPQHEGKKASALQHHAQVESPNHRDTVPAKSDTASEAPSTASECPVQTTDASSPGDAVSSKAGPPVGNGALRDGAGTEGAGTGGTDTGRAGGGKGVGERVFGAPDGPSFLHKVVPSYPASAKRLEKQGTVLLRVTIDECGRPAEIEIIQKAGYGLDEEAARALRESTFVPAKRDGKPCKCKALIPIRFAINE